MSATNNCGNCRFFFPDSPDPDINYGECRRHAPQVVASSYFDRSKWKDVPCGKQVTPTVPKRYWCGDHEASSLPEKVQ